MPSLLTRQIVEVGKKNKYFDAFIVRGWGQKDGKGLAGWQGPEVQVSTSGFIRHLATYTAEYEESLAGVIKSVGRYSKLGASG